MKIKKIFSLLILIILFSGIVSDNIYTYAGGGGGKSEPELKVIIDTSDLTGINLWIAETYNNDRLLYAIVVTLVMATLGTIMAFGTDQILKHFGISVSKISHHE